MNWYKFFTTTARHLSLNPCASPGPATWCSWTTFARLGENAGYWTYPFPLESELLETGTTDGGTWGQPFAYHDIAHIIVPRRFFWDLATDKGYECGEHMQDIKGLSALLQQQDVEHRLTELVLEVKLY